ncbi:MAG: hypothetical protein HQK83_04910 [Fibrobacteria bacterium]|nr:hypothetical protein [Fibrobacteria bacterium]
MKFKSLVFGFFLCCFSFSEDTITAGHLLSVLQHGLPITDTVFKTDHDKVPTIAIDSLEGALFWTADMDIDCDGEPDDKCNSETDPWFYDATSAGKGIYAAKTPFIVIPKNFDYKSHGIQLGSVAAVIYNNKLVYGPFLDAGPDNVLGEASYAMADSLGINPDPRVGGTDGPVTYIVFTDSTGQLSRSDFSDHDKAIEVGVARAKQLLSAYEITGTSSTDSFLPGDNFKVGNDKLSIDFPGHHLVKVMNIQGRIVFQQDGYHQQVYNLSRLPRGIYAINVSGSPNRLLVRY